MRIITCLLALLATPALPQSMTELLIPVPNPCYGRIYDADHMAAHPDQLVRMINIRAYGQSMQNRGSGDPDLYLLLQVGLRDDPTVYQNSGFCSPAGADYLDCRLEGDGGQMRMRIEGETIAFVPGRNGMMFEGSDGFFGVGMEGGTDDRLFLLKKEECY